MSCITKLTHSQMNRFRWFRRACGGNWFHVIPRDDPSVEFWCRFPLENEHITSAEAYNDAGGCTVYENSKDATDFGIQLGILHIR